MGRVASALFLSSFATFSLLYCTQPLLTQLALDYHVDAATSSWAVSATTAALAVSIVTTAALPKRLSRRRAMCACLLAAALLNLACAFAPRWPLLLMARVAEGLALGGVPGTAMAYLAEEVPLSRLGLAMGLNVSGAAFGGMTGRVAMGVLAQAWSWRMAISALSVLDLAAAVAFLVLLPSDDHSSAPERTRRGRRLQAWKEHLQNRRLLGLFAVAFLAMGAFVAVYNYIGFRLVEAPYNLRPARIGLIFLTYLMGMVAASVAGVLADRFGRRLILLVGAVLALAGEALTLAAPLELVIVGIALLTGGFFVVHSVASGWVGQLARTDQGRASALYLLAYYCGASALGSAGGWFWRGGGWGGVIGGCAAAMLTVLAIGFALSNRAAPGRRADVKEPETEPSKNHRIWLEVEPRSLIRTRCNPP